MKSALVCLGLALSTMAGVAVAVPACLDDNGNEVAVNNDQVEQWMQSTKDNFHARGHIQGQVSQLLPNKTGHTHFNVDLGDGTYVEVIYDTEFGRLPRVSVGMQVEACGDYITVEPGEPGETGDAPGILHWIHRSDNDKHPDGYLSLNGDVYGD